MAEYQKWDAFRPGRRGLLKILKHRMAFLILGRGMMRKWLKHRIVNS